ncbi:MAG: serine/threonine protein kinase [Cellvibrionaceae bacterium]
MEHQSPTDPDAQIHSNNNHPYEQLTPDCIISAVESQGYRSDARILALNSYENRVYQVGIEEQSPLIAKFYRPNRWTDEQIREEHRFTLELAALEIPVVPPLVNDQSQTLMEYSGFRFSLYSRQGGHTPELDNLENLVVLGRFLGRIHAAGSQSLFTHRPTVDIQSYGIDSVNFLSGGIPNDSNYHLNDNLNNAFNNTPNNKGTSGNSYGSARSIDDDNFGNTVASSDQETLNDNIGNSFFDDSDNNNRFNQIESENNQDDQFTEQIDTARPTEDFIPPELRDSYRSLTEDLLDRIQERFDAIAYRTIRLHGDCHPSNILWREDRPHFVDFDDARNGPAIQDLWMLLSGSRSHQTNQISKIMEGYTQFHDFDPAELNLIESLRSLRIMQYAAWLARRWADPAFPRNFPWFNTTRYWSDHILELREQLAVIEEPSLELIK